MGIRASWVIASSVLVLVFTAPPTHSQDRSGGNDRPGGNNRQATEYPFKIPGAVVEVYKSVGDVELNAYIFNPKDHQPDDRRPAIVFFFGGGWRSGSPQQFVPHCQHLADNGMVAVAVDYRVASRHGVKAVDCVSDAKSAVRWLRANASRLGIDPDKIAAGGGSAGGHLAACTAILKQFDEPDEDALISSVPNATVLFNPAVVLAAVSGKSPASEERLQALSERMGVPSAELSPYHQLSGSVPPTIIFHGQDDKTVPYETAEIFTQAMQKAGNRCELVGFEGQGHGFFNANRADGKYYKETIEKLDEFLASLGYLQ